MKLDATVKKETVFVASVTSVLSALMQAVFLVIGKWSIFVLFGNLLGALLATANFLLLGITLQKAVTKDEEQAKNTMKLSRTLRNMMIVAVVAAGIALPCFDTAALLISLFFPRIALFIRGFMMKKENSGGEKNEE